MTTLILCLLVTSRGKVLTQRIRNAWSWQFSLKIKAGEFDLSGMLAGIKAEADARGARRIVFDSIDVLLTLLDDRFAERREIYRLDNWLCESGLTGIITAKSQGVDPFVAEGYGFMQFMTDCVVALKLRLVDQIALRYVQVMKYRGSGFAENEVPLVIGLSGMEVADISAMTVAPEASPERVSSGVERLDAMLGGGYFRGSRSKMNRQRFTMLTNQRSLRRRARLRIASRTIRSTGRERI